MKIHEPSSIKRQERRHLRQLLRGIGQEEHRTASAAIVERLERALEGCSSGAVLLYAALPTEANIWDVVRRCERFRFALPRVADRDDGGPAMDCWVFDDRENDLERGAFGVEEPIPAQCQPIAVEELDVVIVPAMAYTAAGARLGKGGGYYDWLLGQPGFRARTLGVCFACQLVDELPAEVHDRRVDQVITELQ